MKALKCDRCGALYESYSPLNCSGDRKGTKYYSIKMDTIPDICSRRLDLCENCQRELILWIDGYNSVH